LIGWNGLHVGSFRMGLKRLRIQEKIEILSLKIYPCETYDDVVVRIIQEYEKNKREKY
jgi:hypothetical protein